MTDPRDDQAPTPEQKAEAAAVLDKPEHVPAPNDPRNEQTRDDPVTED